MQSQKIVKCKYKLGYVWIDRRDEMVRDKMEWIEDLLFRLEKKIKNVKKWKLMERIPSYSIIFYVFASQL